jgi:dephospho-CoA kinase
MPYVIGLTGGIGCGKSAASDYFKQKGVDIIDADLLAREVVAPNTPAMQKIIEHFGKAIVSDAGELNRAKLRQLVFENPDERHWLESLLHPLIRQRIHREIDEKVREESVMPSKLGYIVLSAPLLLENKLDALVDRVLVIDCDEELQLQRALARDESDAETVKKIIKKQISREERLAQADDVITNNRSLNELHKKLETYHHQLTHQSHEYS